MQGSAIDLPGFDAQLERLREELNQQLTKSAHVLEELHEGVADNGTNCGEVHLLCSGENQFIDCSPLT
jgi:hypothetical protein